MIENILKINAVSAGFGMLLVLTVQNNIVVSSAVITILVSGLISGVLQFFR